jgi:SAM-dependent methyltransferase
VATDIVLTEVLHRRRNAALRESGVIQIADWPNAAGTEAVIEHLLSAQAIADVLDVAWGLGKGAKILHLGAGAGRLVAALRELGYDAVGVECDRVAFRSIPADQKEHHRFAEFTDVPFENETFDAVIDTGLCLLPSELTDKAIAEG